MVNWDNLAPRKLTVRLAPGGAALLMDGRTVVKLDGPMPAPGSYRAFLGQKDDARTRRARLVQQFRAETGSGGVPGAAAAARQAGVVGAGRCARTAFHHAGDGPNSL